MIKLSEEQEMHSSVRGILERHLSKHAPDCQSIGARQEQSRFHDIAKIITDEVLHIQNAFVMEREAEKKEKSNLGHMGGSLDSRAIRPATANEVAAESTAAPEDRTLKSDMRILFVNERSGEHFIGRVHVLMDQR